MHYSKHPFVVCISNEEKLDAISTKNLDGNLREAKKCHSRITYSSRHRFVCLSPKDFPRQFLTY